MDIDGNLPPEKMDFSADQAFHEIHIDGQENLHVDLIEQGSGIPEREGSLTSAIHLNDPTNKKIMDTDDSVDAVPELNFSEVKEQMLKEVEEMKDGATLQPADVGAVPHEDIENLFNVKPTDDDSTLVDQEQSHSAGEQISEKIGTQEEPSTANPNNISTDDVKAAVHAIKSLDVLVCGNCHLTFNFVEEFTKHKTSCSSKSPFLGGMIEQKPTIWAFLLFKNALVTQNPQKYSGGLTESSWKLYQKWCKMPESTRNTWVTAGESVMKYLAVGNIKKDVSKVAPFNLKGQEKSTFEDDDPKRPVIMKKFCQRDQSGEVLKIRPGGHISQNDMRSSISEDSEPSKSRMDDDDSLDVPTTTMLPKKAENIREEEFVVERIVSRRFNPRRKQYEYLLKWEGYPPEQNTWEPAENLETCQHLLKAFEESLNKQSINKMKTVTSRKSDYNIPSSSGSTMNNFGRPVRSSKQKALSQVKQWCGSIKPDEAEIETLMKRKLPTADSDDDDDNFVGKRLRMGSDSEESLVGRSFNKGSSGMIKKTTNSTSTPHRAPGRPRKYPQQPGLHNGAPLRNSRTVESSDEGEGKSTLEILSHANVTKTLDLSPANQQVLVANAKGVVKVDPSQVPNLSSGVYIMSNKSGIIKLDSVSPSKALSMKQGIVKDISPSLKTTAAPQPSKSVMLNKSQPSIHQELTPKSGIVRKTQMPPQVTSRISPSPSILPGGKTTVKQLRASGNIKINSSNTNTRFMPTGNRSNVTITSTNKPKTIIRTTEPQKKMLEVDRTLSSQQKIGRGGILAGSLRGGRGGSTPMRSGITRVTPSLPNLPSIVTASPPRSLSLCQETGKVLMKSEGEKNPHPSPPPIVSSTTTPLPTESDLLHSPIVIKEEYIEKTSPAPIIPSSIESDQIIHVPQQHQLKPIRSKKEETPLPKAKESLVKRTLGKPGSIGSMTVSPKKILPEIEDPDSDVVTISGEDGMIYKVSKSELNNSLLMAGEDGQQCVYLTTGENGDENATVITLDPSSYSEQVNQLGQQVNVLGEVGEEEATQYYVKEGEEGELMDLQMQGQEGDDGQSQLVAQLVEAGEPAPGGGPRRVVLLLPDGNLMMTEVDEEQYAALELDKFQGQTAEME